MKTQNALIGTEGTKGKEWGARLEPTRMEVGTGEPGYRWADGCFVINPEGQKLYPPFTISEAKAFCKKQGWPIIK